LKEAASKIKEQSRTIEMLQHQLQSMESKSVDSSDDSSSNLSRVSITFPSCAATTSSYLPSSYSSSSSDFNAMLQCDPEAFQRFCVSLSQHDPSVSKFIILQCPTIFLFSSTLHPSA
jgi:hypothetical protein